MERLGGDDPREIGGYRLLGRLGTGGMGCVYLARTPGHRRVALKVIHPHLAGEAGFRSRFAREVTTARRVSGVFTAAVLDADPDAEVPWMATEYLPGPTLRQAVSEGGPLRGDELRALAAALAEALDGIHTAGLVHRDLKPGNIVLAADGPRVIDFGIAKALDAVEATHTARGFGTLAYVSPEQALGGTATEASDVFALGSVLVFAATGEPPFGTAPQAAVIHRIVDREPDLERVPEGLRAALTDLLAKDPGRRPSAREAVRALGGTPELVRWEPGGAVERLVADSERETARLTERLPEDGPEHAPEPQAVRERRLSRGARFAVFGGGGVLAAATAAALVVALTVEGAPWSNGTGTGTGAEYPELPLSVLEPVETNALDVEFGPEVVRGISPSGEAFAWAPADELAPVHFVALPAAPQVHTLGNNRTREVPRRLAVADAPWFWGTVYEDGSSLMNRVSANDPDLDSGSGHQGYTAVGIDTAGGVPVAGTGDGRFGLRFGEEPLAHTHRNPDGSQAMPSAVDAVAVDRAGGYMASAAAVGGDRNIRVVPLSGPDLTAGDDLYLSPDTGEEVTAMALGPDGSVVVFAVSGTVLRWNTEDDTAEPLPAPEGETAVDSVAISPDGTLAAASGPEGTVNVWHVPSAQPVATMEIPEGPAPLAFTGDGNALRTVDAENVFTEWDVSGLG